MYPQTRQTCLWSDTAIAVENGWYNPTQECPSLHITHLAFSEAVTGVTLRRDAQDAVCLGVAGFK
jgi:hypothetical protein